MPSHLIRGREVRDIASSRLRCSASTVTNLIKSGRLPSPVVKVSERIHLYDRAAVEAAIDAILGEGAL
jgi:hypothetical protein